MEELLGIILQLLFEFVLEVLANVPFDWLSRNRTTPESDNHVVKNFLWFGGGCVLAGLSLLVVGQSIITVPALRIVNLVLAPVVSAVLSEAIANRRARTNPFIIPRNHFWQAFWFTLGLTLIRFTFASHS